MWGVTLGGGCDAVGWWRICDTLMMVLTQPHDNVFYRHV